MAFKDYFSTQARQYTQYRPRYPGKLFEYLSSLTARHELVWDCGTGNGQAAGDLAQFFDEVIATDPSASQLAHAERHSKVRYLVASAEECPLASASVDLITVAQAMHWFDLPSFYEQVRRVGRAGGVLAAWSYGLAQIIPEVDAVVARLYWDLLGAYWPPERRLIEERYATIWFPFDEITAPDFSMTAEWNCHEFLGYLGTWSAVQKYSEQQRTAPLKQVEEELRQAWGPAGQIRQIHWPLYLRAGHLRSE